MVIETREMFHYSMFNWSLIALNLDRPTLPNATGELVGVVCPVITTLI